MTEVTISTPHHRLKGYVAMPRGDGPWPGVIVLHDIFGLTDVTRQHADWLAKEGYLAVAPDLFSWGGRLRCIRALMVDLSARNGAAPGHSPSHASILFTSGKEQFMHMGDIAHHPVTSLQHPDWTPLFDYEPAQAIKSRKAILERVATDRVMVMGYHFPFPAIGHVVRHDKAYRWEAAQWAW
jgi:dienelactone hydrolase